MRLSLYLLSIFFFGCVAKSNSQCNGYESLCIKKYNEVAYLTTHNAYSSFEDGFYLPNQNLNITSQLNQGVRAFMLDVYSEDDELMNFFENLDSEDILLEKMKKKNDVLNARHKKIEADKKLHS